MLIEEVKQTGEYLGYCNQKGYLYSVYRGLDQKGNKKYTIISIKDNKLTYLIDFIGTV